MCYKKSLNLETSSQLVYNISNEVPSVLMQNLLTMISTCLFEMTNYIHEDDDDDDEDGDNDCLLKQGFIMVIHEFVVGLLQLLKDSGFEYPYMSLNIFDAAFSILGEICNNAVTIDTQICVLLSKILENRIKWSTTSEFCEYFKGENYIWRYCNKYAGYYIASINFAVFIITDSCTKV